MTITPNSVIGVGCSILLCAFFWFASLFPQGTSCFDLIHCMYSNSFDCAIWSGLNSLVGSSYNPIFFWIGVGVTGVGLFMKYNEDKGGNNVSPSS